VRFQRECFFGDPLVGSGWVDALGAFPGGIAGEKMKMRMVFMLVGLASGVMSNDPLEP